MDVSNGSILLGFCFAVIAHCVSWFGFNSQFVWNFWKDKPLLSLLIFSTPATLIFWYTGHYLHSTSKSLWSLRWLMFAASFVPMFIFTKFFMNEPFLTAKNIITLILAVGILIVQTKL